MTKRKNSKWGLFYPENGKKQAWDLFINLVLILTCVLSPYWIAFDGGEEKASIVITNSVMDMLFLLDIIIISNTAYYTEDY